MARPRWPSIGAAIRRWISSPGWPPWYPNQESTSPATMASWHLRGPTEPSLARARHASETRERRQVQLQHRSPHTRRAPCRNDLGSTAKACFQHRHRGLQSLWRICQGHRRGVEPMYRGPGRHRSNTDSPAPERTGNAGSAFAVTTRLVPPTRAPPGTLSLFAGKDSRPTATH